MMLMCNGRKMCKCCDRFFRIRYFEDDIDVLIKVSLLLRKDKKPGKKNIYIYYREFSAKQML